MIIPPTISFSALSDWQYCPHFYRLVNIARLRSFTKTVWSYYGGLLHHYVQEVLQDKMSPEAAVGEFERKWKKFCGLYKKPLFEQFGDEDIPYKWINPTKITIETIKEEFTKQFGKYKILHIEERLSRPIPGEHNQEFKGFIDIVLEQEDGTVVIADFKSCDSKYMFNKFKNKYKDYQLTLYKYFYGKKYNIDLNKIETYFIPCERSPNSKSPLGFVRVTSGSVKIKNAIQWLSLALKGINAGLYMKNRMSCYKYGENKPCIFNKSEHCK